MLLLYQIAVLEQHYSKDPGSEMKQSTFKADRYPIRTIPVTFSVIFLAILNESFYSKELYFVLAKKKKKRSFLPLCSFQYADVQVIPKDVHSVLTL